MLPFNRQPRGLLGLLDAKTAGMTPQEIAGNIIGTLDFQRFFYASGREFIAGRTTTPLTTGHFAFLTGASFLVPSDEVWWVEQFTVKATVALAAAQNLCLVPAHLQFSQGGADLDHQHLADSRYLAAALGEVVSSNAGRAFLALPGDALQVYVQALNGVVTAAVGSASILRMRV